MNFDRLLRPTGGIRGEQSEGKANLRTEVKRSGLKGYIQSTVCSEVDFTSLQSKKGAKFTEEVLTAGARERFFENYRELSVLELFLGYEDARESFIAGGNRQLIDRLLRLSTAKIRAATAVTNITRVSSDLLEVTSEPIGSGQPATEVFDKVIVATSLELGNLSFDPPLPDLPGLKQKYKDSFVTHFTTEGKINGSCFFLDGAMPQNVFTTVPHPDQGDDESEPAFFSLVQLRSLINPKTSLVENLYRIISRKEIPFPNIEHCLETDQTSDRPIISWIDRAPFPRTVPVVDLHDDCFNILEQIEIAPGIYYAGGGEQIVASAEFGCRMGQNVANLIIDGASK